MGGLASWELQGREALGTAGLCLAGQSPWARVLAYLGLDRQVEGALLEGQ